MSRLISMMTMRTTLCTVAATMALLMVPSCKDEKAEQTIKDLELDIESLKSQTESLQAELKASEIPEGSLLPDEAKLVQEKVVTLENEIKEWKLVEGKLLEANREIEALKQKLADATMVPGAKAAAAAVASGESMQNAIQDKTGGVIPAVANSVLIIEGDKSSGTGFMAKVDGKMYFYTAAHVLSGNSKLQVKNAEGTKFSKFGAFEYAEGADMVRMEVKDEVEHYLELVSMDVELQLQAEIAALGNGGGAGVVSMEKGQIMGASGDTVEVNAGIIQGNSGGPVVHLLSGKVVGLVTHLTAERTDIWSDGTRQGEVRRFACRLNKKWDWKPHSVGTFLGEAKKLTEYDQVTRLCFAVAALEPVTTGLRLDTSVGSAGNTVMGIFEENKSVPLVQSIMKMNTELGAKKMALSEVDLKKKFRSVLSEAVAMAKRGDDAMLVDEMSWYHRNSAGASVTAREEAMKLLNANIEAMK